MLIKIFSTLFSILFCLNISKESLACSQSSHEQENGTTSFHMTKTVLCEEQYSLNNEAAESLHLTKLTKASRSKPKFLELHTDNNQLLKTLIRSPDNTDALEFRLNKETKNVTKKAMVKTLNVNYCLENISSKADDGILHISGDRVWLLDTLFMPGITEIYISTPKSGTMLVLSPIDPKSPMWLNTQICSSNAMAQINIKRFCSWNCNASFASVSDEHKELRDSIKD